MRNKLIIITFICLVFVQIAIPFSMIMKREFVLRSGAEFKFKTAPVDPYDAFRGRYVALRLEGDEVTVSRGLRLHSGQNVYALISADEQGYANLTSVIDRKPANEPYIQAKVRYLSGDKAKLDLGIDRYYMEEKSAPKAERVFRQQSRGDKQGAYLSVKIKGGFPVIQALYVGGKRIEDAVRAIN